MTIRPLFRALFPVAVLLASAPALVAREGRDGSDAVRDPRVLEMLTAANLRFTADKDGDAIVRFRVGSGEEQTVTVVSSTARLRDLEMRDAYAVAVTGSGKTPDDLFEDLLLRNEESDFGAWEWVGSEKTDDRDWAVAFRAKIPARMTPSSFKAALRQVAKTAAEFRSGFSPATARPASRRGDSGEKSRIHGQHGE